MSSEAIELSGHVEPPADMMLAARMELSEEGFARLMATTGGIAPTPWQLVREVEFERSGSYPPDPISLEKVRRAAELAHYIAAAKIELSPQGFTDLMARTNYEPTARDVAQAVDAERHHS